MFELTSQKYLEEQAKPNFYSFSTYTKEKNRIKQESNTYTRVKVSVLISVGCVKSQLYKWGI
jgi:hypothetical protein